jgi:hypothetical protein
MKINLTRVCKSSAQVRILFIIIALCFFKNIYCYSYGLS